MTISSAQPTYSVTSIDTIDLSSLDTITLTTNNLTYDTSSVNTITISGGTGYTIGSGLSTASIASLSISDISTINTPIWKSPEEWNDKFPDWNRVQDMCEQYPGLKIAFEKFKTTYKLVKDDYDTPKDKRVKP